VPVATIFAESAAPAPSIFGGAKPPISVKSGGSILSADRGTLRTLLLKGIESHVTFGRRFKSYTETDDAVLVRFEDDIEVTASILVGADGARSRIRRQRLPSCLLLDTEARLIFGKSTLTESLASQLSKEALQGLTLIQGSSTKCLLEPMHFDKKLEGLPDDYIYWVLFLRSDSDDTPSDLLSRDATEIKALTHRLTSNWHPSLRCIFEDPHVSQQSALQVLSADPDAMNWTQDSCDGRVTLIGDAAHVMSPTAALGATTALQDAATLVASIRSLHAGSKALRDYEHQMGPYASEALKKSVMGGKVMFGMRPFVDLPRVQV
jgi:2-polyprenyl-6-methoxyphenol hydroxylase-like FAD-dependent oxidoreductase